MKGIFFNKKDTSSFYFLNKRSVRGGGGESCLIENRCQLRDANDMRSIAQVSNEHAFFEDWANHVFDVHKTSYRDGVSATS